MLSAASNIEHHLPLPHIEAPTRYGCFVSETPTLTGTPLGNKPSQSFGYIDRQ